ncbi:hypothetical protein ABZ650_20330 [Streptomyces griseoviridis]|uniref:hypothetical protein n=1 Tax=Streptomyces griseoviridis TaxID=45398 RepID=UPI0033F324E3
MTIHFLPESYVRAIGLDIVVPVSGCPDLMDPSNRRIVIPARVEMHFRRDEGTPRGDREYVYVCVVGPRRLKSGEPGKPIASTGWERSRVEGRWGYVDRPDWLTGLIAAQFPKGWSASLAELEAERHSTDEAPDGAVQELRAPSTEAVLDDFIARCEVALSGCCSECDAAIAIVKGCRQAALDGAPVPELPGLLSGDALRAAVAGHLFGGGAR